MSGDEFFVFLYGGASKEEIRNIVRSLHSRLLDTIVLLPGQESNPGIGGDFLVSGRLRRL